MKNIFQWIVIGLFLVTSGPVWAQSKKKKSSYDWTKVICSTKRLKVRKNPADKKSTPVLLRAVHGCEKRVRLLGLSSAEADCGLCPQKKQKKERSDSSERNNPESPSVRTPDSDGRPTPNPEPPSTPSNPGNAESPSESNNDDSNTDADQGNSDENY